MVIRDRIGRPDPRGGGHPGERSGTGRSASGLGYDHLQVFIDNATRLSFVALIDDERPASAVDALTP